jgi:arsenite methyltransferase
MTHYLNISYNINDKETVSAIDELPLWSVPFGLKLLEKIKYRKNITALDIGSGLGFPLLEVAMRLGNSCKVYGIDPWETAVERIKTKIRSYGIENVEIITGAAENIPLPDNSIDLIISNNGLNNVDDLNKVLSECSRISKIGSQLVFTYNTDKTMSEFYNVFEEVLLEKNMTNEITQMKEHIHKKRKPVEEFISLLNDKGYIINEISPQKFDYKFVDASAMLNHFLIKLAFIESWKSLVPNKRQQEVFNDIEKRLNALADQSGLLRLTIPFVLMDCTKAD